MGHSFNRSVNGKSPSFNHSVHGLKRLKMNCQVILTRPPDINLPLSAERSPPPQPWNPDHCDILDVGLSTQIYKTESFLTVPKAGRKCAKWVDSIWGAWFFFSFYFKPVLNDKLKAKIVRDGNGFSRFDKSDLQLDTFLVQHDMENMYMWVFKERPENALGKMQLRSYMNGHSRQVDVKLDPPVVEPVIPTEKDPFFMNSSDLIAHPPDVKVVHHQDLNKKILIALVVSSSLLGGILLLVSRFSIYRLKKLKKCNEKKDQNSDAAKGISLGPILEKFGSLKIGGKKGSIAAIGHLV